MKFVTVWMKVGLEKLENHEGVAVKALLDSGATGLFMDTAFAKEKEFKMEKLKNPLLVRNVDKIANVGGAIYSATCFLKDMWRESGWMCVTWERQR